MGHPSQAAAAAAAARPFRASLAAAAAGGVHQCRASSAVEVEVEAGRLLRVVAVGQALEDKHLVLLLRQQLQAPTERGQPWPQET